MSTHLPPKPPAAEVETLHTLEDMRRLQQRLAGQLSESACALARGFVVPAGLAEELPEDVETKQTPFGTVVLCEHLPPNVIVRVLGTPDVATGRRRRIDLVRENGTQNEGTMTPEERVDAEMFFNQWLANRLGPPAPSQEGED